VTSVRLKTTDQTDAFVNSVITRNRSKGYRYVHAISASEEPSEMKTQKLSKLVISMVAFGILCLGEFTVSVALGQGFGVELHNTMNPVAGGMGGASIARPQENISAINGNPASLTKLRGTQFTFGSGWLEATHNLDYQGTVPGLSPFSGKSGWPGSAPANIGVSQELSALGLPVVSGIALNAIAGAGAEFRAQAGSNGATLGLSVLHARSSTSVLVTDKFSIGTGVAIGTASLDAPFVGTGALSNAYSIRGSVGINYDIEPCTSIGIYYESKSHFQFSRAIQPLGLGPFLDVEAELPQNVGMGIASSRFLDGRLLLAFDIMYKNYEDTDLFGAIYDDQWSTLLGSQLTLGNYKLRAGYTFADNNMRNFVPDSAGNVPVGVPAVQFIQGLAPSISPHRMSFGIGRDNLLPGVDLNLFGGAMFESTEQFGDTTVSIKTYYLGGGLTWRFRRGSAAELDIPDEWCGNLRNPGDGS
jgi:long-chain fatty acid transport protein